MGLTAPDIEPSWAATLDRRLTTRTDPPYVRAELEDVRRRLERFLSARGIGGTARSLRRLGGGGSKEQFTFTSGEGEKERLLVLRMDPREGLVASSREREFEALALLASSVPVPEPVALDAEGTYFSQPAMITSFCEGTTKPSTMNEAGNITGNGTVMGAYWRERLSGQFVRRLADIHNAPWRSDGLRHIGVPDGDPFQAARWQVNAWGRVWREDKNSSLPTMTLARRWMLDNLPPVDRLAFVHGDYRTGNYLFDERGGEITAILDLEMCHIGDHHEDLAWAMQPTNGSTEDGVFYGSGLMRPDEFFAAYERASSRRVDPRALHFYRVFAVYKSIAIAYATTIRIARARHSHQDIIMTWMAGCGHVLHALLCELLDTRVAA